MTENKFDELFGIGLYPIEKEPFIIWVSNNGHIAYINVDLFEKQIDDELDWMAFIFNPPDYLDGFVYFNNQYYNLEYISKTIEVLNPDFLSIVEAKHTPSGEINHLLLFKNENEGILIPPAILEHVNKEKVLNLDEIMKRVASDVNVI